MTNEAEQKTELSFWSRCTGVSPADRRNQRMILVSTLSWALSFVGAAQAIKREVVSGPSAWIVAALPVVLGVWVLFAYGKFLRQTDELARLVQLEGLGAGFGGTFFALCAYSVLQRLGSPVLELQDVPTVMAVFYVLGVFLAWRRYR